MLPDYSVNHVPGVYQANGARIGYALHEEMRRVHERRELRRVFAR